MNGSPSEAGLSLANAKNGPLDPQAGRSDISPIEHAAAVALEALLASPELRAGAAKELKDHEIVAEYERRKLLENAPDQAIEDEYKRRNFVETEPTDTLGKALDEEKISMHEVFETIKQYEIEDDLIKDLCKGADIELAEDVNERIVEIARRIAFGNFATWSINVRDLIEEFKRVGIYY